MKMAREKQKIHTQSTRERESERDRKRFGELNPFAWTFPGALPSVSMIYDGQLYSVHFQP